MMKNLRILFVLFLLSSCMTSNQQFTQSNANISFPSQNLAEDSFIDAIKTGDHPMVEKMIAEGMDINQKYGYLGESPIYFAIRKKDVKAARILIDNGALINITNMNKQTPLMLAYQSYFDIEMLKLLVNNGAKTEDDLINFAVKYNDDMAGSLSDSMDIKTIVDADGANVLMYAARTGNVDLVRKCIEAGIDVNSRDKYMETPLMYAADNGDVAIGEILLEHDADINANTDQKGYIRKNVTAVFKAAMADNSDFLELLLKYGAEMNYLTTGMIAWSPLMGACYHGNYSCAELLLKYGADIHMRSSEGYTALHYAAYEHPGKFAELLVDYGADVHAKNKYGHTAIMNAARSNRDTLFTEILIKAGADINEKDDYGSSPILEAAKKVNEIQFRYLAKHGANENDVDKNGKTAKDILVKYIMERNKQNKYVIPDKYKLEPGIAVSFIPFDIPPKPVGGPAKLAKNFIYPEFERKSGITGEGVVQAYINEHGDVEHCAVLRPMPTDAMNEAMINGIKITKYIPAKQRDKNIGVWISIPVTFR